MANNIKKVLLTGALALSGAFILAACDDVVAVPQNYQTPIVEKDGQAYVDDENRLGEIYDAITSNKSEKVVSTLLEKLAINEFGTYEEIEACFPGGVRDDALATAHVNAHQHEFYRDEYDNKVHEKKPEVSVESLRLERFEEFRNDLNERINKVVFDEISSSSYRDTIEETKFLEEKYARAKRQENYNIEGFDENGNTKSGVVWKELYIDSNFKEENVRTYLNWANYGDYIVKGIIPNVFKDKLIEEYIIRNNHSALGRAYARNINYVKISYTDDDSINVFKLVEKFIKEKIVDVLDLQTIDYSSIEAWIKGFKGINPDGTIIPLDGSDDLSSILGAKESLKASFTKYGHVYPTISLEDYGMPVGFEYYEKTKLGEILKDFEKAVLGEKCRYLKSDAEEITKLNEFTDNGKRSIEQGLIKKITDLALEDYSKDGWFVKNDKDGSLSGLPEAIKNRLFNIKVANDFDKSQEELDKMDADKKYFTKVNGHFFLTPSTKTDRTYSYMLDDTSSKAIYIVEIIEAPSTSKLNLDSDKSYLVSDPANPYKSELVAREIAKILGTKETYTTSAYTSYLKLYTFVYHDTSVYEHLKNTYPDLFED